MKKIVAFCLLLVLAVAFFVPRLHAAPEISAECAVLIDAETGRILYGKNENVRRGMASTTKIMTALVALETVSPEKKVTVAKDAVGVEGSSVYLFEGETITMEALLYALMLGSANDAAAAIAIDIAGSIDAFADMMNARAKGMGLSATHFENPHGLDGETHYTTAYELALIAREAMKNELFREIVSTEKKTIPLHDGTASRLLINHNRLLREYDDIIGVKTGFTKKCGRTLVTAAERDGLRLICVTLNDGNDWQDHRALLDHGFSLYEKFDLAEEGAIRFDVPVCGAVRESISISAATALSVMLPKDCGEITATVCLPRFLYAGVEKGTRVGEVRYYAEGKQIAALPLYADESAEIKRSQKSTIEKLLSFFNIESQK